MRINLEDAYVFYTHSAFGLTIDDCDDDIVDQHTYGLIPWYVRYWLTPESC